MLNNTIKIIAVGDIFLADSPLMTGRGVRSSIEKNGQDFFVDKMNKILNDYDICFGNLECVLSDKDYNKYSISSVEIRGESDYCDIISRSGFNIVNIANNHAFQHGLEPYIDTINNLKSRDIKIIGDEYFNNNLEIFEKGDIKIGFVGYSMHYEQYHPDELIPYSLREDPVDILTEIMNIKDNFDGFLVCSLHWGYEFLDSISLEQREFCHQLVDCGVSVILGHHSHVPQGIEKYNGALIAYSLGNFVFDMDIEIANKAFALEIDINSFGVIEYNIIPIHIGSDYCPSLLNNADRDKFIARIEKLTADIINGVSLPAEIMKTNQQSVSRNIYKHNYRSFFKNLFATNMYYNFQIIIRALIRRIGLARNP